MKTTLSVSIEEDLSEELRSEAIRQRRPLSWVVAEAIRIGLKRAHGAKASPVTVGTQRRQP